MSKKQRTITRRDQLRKMQNNLPYDKPIDKKDLQTKTSKCFRYELLKAASAISRRCRNSACDPVRRSRCAQAKAIKSSASREHLTLAAVEQCGAN